MLTFFTTAKAFVGHSDLIQRNALQSWRMLHPDVEVIVFGDDPGAAEVCAELGLRHEPEVKRKENGTKSVRSIFIRAQEIARYERLCYCNCDIVLTRDFRRAIETAADWRRDFFMIGRRWDVDVTDPIDFGRADWQDGLVERARREGFQRLHYNIDYFVFRRGLYREIPDLVIGRNWWDQWLVWQAGAAGAAVVDASDAVCAVHQNHDYAYHPQGMTGVWFDEGTQENFRQAGAWRRLHTIEDARWRLVFAGGRSEAGVGAAPVLARNRVAALAPARRRLRRVVKAARVFVRTRLWHPFLDRTRTVRAPLGLRQDKLGTVRRKGRADRHWLDQ
jgi:hypothetical protein